MATCKDCVNYEVCSCYAGYLTEEDGAEECKHFARQKNESVCR